MLSELEKLSLTLDTLTKPEAERIINAINKVLVNLLNPHIIDLIWKEEGRNGVILRPFISSYDTSRRGGAKPYQLGENVTSIWSWVYRYRQPVWIEDIKSKDLKKPVKNEATGQDIDPLYLNIFQDTDSIMAVPLIFRDVTWGIYSIELPISGKFTEEVLDMLERISRPIALIIWKADTFDLNQRQTADAIRLFTDSILEYGFQEILTPYRSGFIARPFSPDFNSLEACVTNFLVKRQIQARRYVYRQGTGIVIEDIMRQVRSSHFGIVDVTGFNSNVMIELGMFMVLRKKFLVLRRQGDATKLPFDIQSYHVNEYIVQDSQICCWDPVDERYESLESSILNPFILELFNDPNFIAAKPWYPPRSLK